MYIHNSMYSIILLLTLLLQEFSCNKKPCWNFHVDTFAYAEAVSVDVY